VYLKQQEGGLTDLIYIPEDDCYKATQNFFLKRNLQLEYWQTERPNQKSNCLFLAESDAKWVGSLMTTILLWEHESNTMLDLKEYKPGTRIGTLFIVRTNGEQIIELWSPETNSKIKPRHMVHFTTRFLKWKRTTKDKWQRKCMHAMVMIMTILAIKKGKLPGWQTQPSSYWFQGVESHEETQLEDGVDRLPSNETPVTLSPPTAKSELSHYYQCSHLPGDVLHLDATYTTSVTGELILRENYNHIFNVQYGDPSDKMPPQRTRNHQIIMEKAFQLALSRTDIDNQGPFGLSLDDDWGNSWGSSF